MNQENLSNAGCIGYTILALEALGYAPEKINRIALAMREMFDTYTKSEACERFQDSPY